jgi:hypothetical protein
LNLAKEVLPSEAHQPTDEYLAHNELQLAWEAMAKVADKYVVNSEAMARFWRPMAKAAGLMLAVEVE